MNGQNPACHHKWGQFNPMEFFITIVNCIAPFVKIVQENIPDRWARGLTSTSQKAYPIMVTVFDSDPRVHLKVQVLNKIHWNVQQQRSIERYQRQHVGLSWYIYNEEEYGRVLISTTVSIPCPMICPIMFHSIFFELRFILDDPDFWRVIN